MPIMTSTRSQLTANGRPQSQQARIALAWMVIVLLAGAALRLVGLPDAPPGMTHDEAGHGITAWSIVNGTREIYFTIGYGREPLYDYATALVMAGTGPTILAARWASVFFSLLLIAAMYAWTRRAFGVQVALLTAAGLAVSFWPVMAGRQALRSIALPALFTLATLFFWQSLASSRPRQTSGHDTNPSPRSAIVMASIAGFLLGLSVYTYIPSRVMWLAFPLLTLYWWLMVRASSRDLPPHPGQRPLKMLAIALIVAAIVILPLAIHLATNPGLEIRIDELSLPLRMAAAGDFGPLLVNMAGSLRLFTFEGDPTWRYNLPGKPFLGPLMGVLFYGGLAVALRLAVGPYMNRGSRKPSGFPKLNNFSYPGAFLALAWLILGFAPVLATGPELSMTQAISAMPVVYLFPALAMVVGYDSLMNWIIVHRKRDAATGVARITPAVAVILFSVIGLLTARDYFGRWAPMPEVRVQYETTMVTALKYLDERNGGTAAVSTITPGPLHSPAVAQLAVRNPALALRWFDGRESLLLPGDSGAMLVFPGFTPVPPALERYLGGLNLLDELSMRPDDVDRPVRIYAVDGPAMASAALSTMSSHGVGIELPVRFGEHIELLGYALSVNGARPEESITLVTAWRLLQPLPEAMIFAHLMDTLEPLAQADSLGAPGELWAAGDVLLQLHEMNLPPDLPAGNYPVVVGVYTQGDGRRLMTSNGLDMLPLANFSTSHE
jgi:hypothetical protein